jgi:hypothetical protein
MVSNFASFCFAKPKTTRNKKVVSEILVILRKKLTKPNKPNQTKLKQTKPKQTKPNQTIPNQNNTNPT